MTIDRLLSVGALAVAGATLVVAWSQLREANSALRAANTLSLMQDARVVADKIVAADGDEPAQYAAFALYGDFLVSSGYLYSKEQIEPDVWSDIVRDFCNMIATNAAFDGWYTLNYREDAYTELFPSFQRLRDDECDTAG